MLDSSSITNLINSINPDEIYNLAAQSHVSVSFENPIYTTQVGTLGSITILEALKHYDKKIKFYQASSSEIYGKVKTSSQNEQTQFIPQSPYAAAKLYGYWMTKIYRDGYGMFATNGILFNHESPLR